MDDKKYTKKRKIIGLIILILVLLALGALTWVITQRLIEIGGSAGDMQEFIASFGYAGWLVALGFQVLQILVAFIPGELVESGMGLRVRSLAGHSLVLCGSLYRPNIGFCHYPQVWHQSHRLFCLVR